MYEPRRINPEINQVLISKAIVPVGNIPIRYNINPTRERIQTIPAPMIMKYEIILKRSNFFIISLPFKNFSYNGYSKHEDIRNYHTQCR